MGLFDDLIPSAQAAPAPAPVVAAPPPPQANGLFDDLIPGAEPVVDPMQEPTWGQKLQGGVYDLMGGYNAAQLAAAQDDLAEAEAQAPDMGTVQRVLQTGTYLSRDERIAAAKERRAEALKNLTYYNRRSASVPQGPAMENFNKQEGFLDTLGAFAESPVDVGSSLVLRSLPASAPSIVGGVGGFAVGGPVGAALGAGLGSAMTEYGSGITDQLREFGADLNDEASILATWEAHQDEILKKAGLRAAIVGGTDAATGGLTGRIARTALSPIKKTATGTGVQMVGGGGGEAAAEVFADEKPVSWPNVMGEVLAEGVHGGLEAAGEVGIDASRPVAYPRTSETVPAPSYGLFDDLVPAPAAPALEAPVGTRQSKVVVNTEDDLASARPVVNTEATEAQKKAGNYQKSHLKLHGMEISIENPKGSIRSGRDADGQEWHSPELPADYGYLKKSTGADGDHLDVYIGPEPLSDKVFVINQKDLTTGKFDETKTILGARSPAEAQAIYTRSFSDGQQKALDRIGDLLEVSVDEFKRWVREGKQRAPFPVSKRNARPKQALPLQGVDQYDGQVPKSELSAFPQLRGPGDQGASQFDPLRGISDSSGRAAYALASVGQDRQRQGLPAGQPPLAYEERAGAEYAQEPLSDAQWQDQNSRRMGGRGGLGAIDAPLSDDVRNVGQGYNSDATSRGPQARLAQVAHHDTPEFKRWFGGSKIVDEKGAPRVVYHGTKRDFDEFKSRYADGLLFFSTNPKFAAKWPIGTGGLREASDDTKKILPAARAFQDQLSEEEGSYGFDWDQPDAIAKHDAMRARIKKRFMERYSPYETTAEIEAAADLRVMPVYLSVQNPFNPAKDYKQIEKFLQSLPRMTGIVEHGYHKEGNWVVYESADVIEELKRLGYDGIYLAETVGGPLETIAVFSPNQIKSAIGNSGAYDPTKQSILAQAKPEATFFSALIKAVQSIKQEKAPASQWMSMIKNLPGVKTEEVAWTQLEEFLASATGTVTKTQILDHLNANQVQVRETMMGESRAVFKKDFATAEELYEEISDDPQLVYRNGILRDGLVISEGTNGRFQLMDYSGQVRPGTKFHQYQLHGGENYRELLLTLPGSREVFDDLLERRAGETDQKRIDLLNNRAKAVRDAGDFKSSHFDKYNILAHIRFNERTVKQEGNVVVNKKSGNQSQVFATMDEALEYRNSLPESVRGDTTIKAADKETKVLFIEEIQSDWHQAGRKRGYHGQKDTTGWTATEGKGDPASGPIWQVYDANSRWVLGVPRGNHPTAEAAIRHAANQWADSVPDAPFKTTWPELAMKRVVRYAAENGFDKIAWTTGAVQVDRYNSALRNSVDTLYWEKTDKGIHLSGWQGNTEVVNTHEKEDALSDAIGKSMADQIIASPKQEGKFKGDSIAIADTGMAAFYDKILVNIANKLGKKFDAKVGRVAIGDPGKLRYEGPTPTEEKVKSLKVSYAGTKMGEQLAQIYSRVYQWASTMNFAEAMEEYGSAFLAEKFGGKLVPATIEMPSIEITQSMRGSVMQGQPLFNPGPAKRTFDDYWRSASATRRDQIRANVHAMAEQMLGHRIRIATPRTIVDEHGRSTPNQGDFNPDDRTISVAIDVALSASGTLAHESIHAMRDLGIITAPEWALLKRAAEPLIRDTRAIYEQGYRDRIDVTEEQLQDLMYEEAVAELFNYKVTKAERHGADPMVIRLINKIKQFLEALRNYFNRDGFRTSTGIFDDMLAGKFKTRKEVVGPGRGYYLTSKNHDKPMFTGFN